MAQVKTYSIGSIYGLAKCPELNLDNDTLHDVVRKVTGKESIKILSDLERRKVVIELVRLKELCKMDIDMNRISDKVIWASQDQIYQIHKLEKELGWSDNSERLKGFMKKYSRRENLKWLTITEASNLIESLKACKKNMNGRRRMVK